MWKIALLIAGIAVAIKYPTFTKWAYSVPILGFTFGGLAWCVLAIINPNLVSLKAFGAMCLVGMVLASMVIGKTS